MVSAVQIDAITTMKRLWFFGKAVAAPKHWTLPLSRGVLSLRRESRLAQWYVPRGISHQ